MLKIKEKMMATIKVIDNYEIDINTHMNHEAREFIKIYKNPTTGIETPMYRTIGHYSSVEHAMNGIYKDMCVKKANESDSISVKGWIEIINDCNKRMEKVIADAKLN
jgi:hypothetical protein